MKQRLTSRKIVQLLLVLAILLTLIAYRTWFVGPAPLATNPEKDQICDLSHSPCPAILGDKPLSVSIAALPVRAEHDFVVRLQGADPALQPVKAWLEGRDMFMGTIPVSFTRQGDGWQGSAQVGSCTSALMVWQLNIQWSNGQQQQFTLSVSG